MHIKWLFVLVASMLLSGCAPDGTIVRRNAAIVAPPPGEVLYVVPFAAVMVPQEIVDGIFDRLIDELNATSPNGAPAIILKRDLKQIDIEWLATKHYLTGELFGYVRDSGCCSTEIRLRTRINYYQPGNQTPTLVVTCQREELFDHDLSTFDAEQQKMIAELTQTLIDKLRQELNQSRL
jgi:hypothetical protein